MCLDLNRLGAGTAVEQQMELALAKTRAAAAAGGGGGAGGPSEGGGQGGSVGGGPRKPMDFTLKLDEQVGF